MNNSVISASAGSGKTHRLALEYIALLIKHLPPPTPPRFNGGGESGNPRLCGGGNTDFHFERILVITFTRKAAAEIRNKIFSMLDEIINKRETRIITQIEEKTGLQLDEERLNALYEVYVNIKTHKDKVRISTIDSLINQVFKTMIAPIMKLSHYTIDESANFSIWENLFDELVKDSNIDILYNLTIKNPKKDVQSFAKIFNTLIDNRWVMGKVGSRNSANRVIKSAYTGEYITKKDDDSEDTHISQFQREKSQSLRDFTEAFTDHCRVLSQVIYQKMREKDKPFNYYLTKLGREIFNGGETVNHFLEKGIYHLSKTTINELLKDDKIKLYDGRYIKALPVKAGDTYSALTVKAGGGRGGASADHIATLKTAFARFIYYHYVAPEVESLSILWERILQRYDQLKAQSGVLSYDDITWYTYKYLHSPEYSMIDEEKFIVENQFYEFLAVRNQYLLIDEFQDTSLMQFMILAPMMNELSSGYSVYDDTAVIVVGDEKQSIYGWRGGEKGLLGYMTDFLKCPTESLNTCYRSAPAIVDYVNKVFTEIKVDGWYYPPDIKSAYPDQTGSVIEYHYTKDKKDKDGAYFEFVNKLISHSEFRIPNSTTAILARENRDLDKIAQLLSEHNIPFVRESSRSVFEHTIPRAIMFLLRYIAYRDYLSLLKFLRSDVILIDSGELKEIAKHLSENDTLSSNSTLHTQHSTLIINEIDAKYHSTKDIDILYKNPLILCSEIINRFNIAQLFANEVDMKNLHIFMGIISDFLNSPGEYKTDLDGFIRYADELLEKKSHKQQSTAEPNAINLLTIHKSKGLGFDNVFVYLDTTDTRHRPSPLEIDFIVDDQAYNGLSDVFLSFNYKPVLNTLFENEYQKIEQKRLIEEINVKYVALTRAKTNMVVFSVEEETPEDRHQTSEDRYQTSEDSAVPCEQEITLHSAFHSYFDLENEHLTLKKLDTDEYLSAHLKDLFLIKKSKLYGSATHLYLSFIKYNQTTEHTLAYLNTLKMYGNILTPTEIEAVISKAKSFIDQYPQYFSTTWDKVFTEFAILDKENKLYRLDRMMINTINKQILILDYKTGEISDKDQINHYIYLIKQLPQSKGFTITGEFLSI